MIPERDFSMQRAQNPQKTDFGFFRLLVLSKTRKPLIQKGWTFSQTANWQLQIPIPEVKTGRKRVLSRGEENIFHQRKALVNHTFSGKILPRSGIMPKTDFGQRNWIK